MVIRTEATLALYCPHCGKLHMHSFNRFNLPGTAKRELVCSCGQIQAAISSVGRRQYLLDIPCVLCETTHKVCIDARRFWRAEADKLYCAEENIELGLFGRSRIIEKTFADHKNELDQLPREAEYDDEHIDNPQVMFGIFNRIHDMAEQGDISCRCGQFAIDAEVLPNCIELTCRQCGSRRVVPALTDSDLEQVKSWEFIQLIPQRRSRHKQ